MEVKEFGNELKRMFESLGGEPTKTLICEAVECSECPFNVEETCILNFDHINTIIDIVTAWREEHPRKTNKNVFLKAFPNAKLYANGLPAFCAYQLGLVDIIGECDMDCARCWNEEYNGVDVERLRNDTKGEKNENKGVC